MKRLIILTALLISAAPAFAQSITGSKHDLRATGGGTATGTNLTEICVACHTPHQAASANKQDPLWNRTLSSQATYGVYSSTSLDAAPTELGGASIGTAQISNLCLSCHDGTVSVISMLNEPNSAVGTISAATIAGRISSTGMIIGNANVGTDLTDDHPVNFNYNAALMTTDGGLSDPTALTGVKLFGGTVQCASCHKPHDRLTGVPFLRVNNTGSALCLKCHTK